MAKKAELKAVLTLNNSQFARTIQNSINLARRFTRQLVANPVKTLGLTALVGAEKGLKLGIAAVGAFKIAATAAYTIIGTKAIQAAANMETVRVGFETLLGSAQKAGERMAQIQSFGQKAPFDFDEIAKGAKMLQILTDGALSGSKSLEMIGDVAAGTQREFSETAETIGQLYAALRIGLPIGQQLMQLRNTGAVTDFGSKRIAQISTAGTPKAAAEAWRQVTQEFARFQGLSAKTATTWNGMATQFHNVLQLSFAEFGAPLLEVLKPKLEALIEGFLSHKDEFAAMGKAFADAIASGLEKSNAFFNRIGQMFGPKTTPVMGDVSPQDLAEVDRRQKARGQSGGRAAAMNGLVGRRGFAPRTNFLGKLADFRTISTDSGLTTSGLKTGGFGPGGASSGRIEPFGPHQPGFVAQMGNPLGQGPARATNFLRFRQRRANENELRAQEMAIRYGAAGYTGSGRAAGDTRVRRGDRQRMRQVALENKRKEDQALSNKTFAEFMKAFDEFAKKMSGG